MLDVADQDRTLASLRIDSNTRLAAIPVMVEAARVPVFARSRNALVPKARVATNSDMVKPMPQTQLAPKNLPPAYFGGNCCYPALLNREA
jgi:hypothetical protein